MKEILEGFRVVNVNDSESRSQVTFFSDHMRFNKATAAELNFPSFVRLLVYEDDTDFKIAIEVCNGHCKEAVRFSEMRESQTYAITVRHPATMVMVRRFLDFSHSDNESVHYIVKGKLHLEENVIIYDLSDAVKETKTFKKKKKTNKEEDV